jgi:hypothetical protein
LQGASVVRVNQAQVRWLRQPHHQEELKLALRRMRWAALIAEPAFGFHQRACAGIHRDERDE